MTDPLRPKPKLSVVVASNRAPELLRACLESLQPQCRALGAELIVARAGSSAESVGLAGLTGDVRFISAPQTAAIPELRGLGMTEATGDVVAITEDHCVADPAWASALLAQAGSADVLGGGMGNAQTQRAVDWGAYFSEYGFFAETRPQPAPGGYVLLTGANAAYTRRVVGQVAAWALEGEWENVAHQRLTAQGVTLRFVPEAVVRQNRNYGLWSFCVDRYEHGRDYARKRLAEGPQGRRWLLLAATLLLPALLTWRVAAAAAPGRVSSFLRALPATFTFLTAWSLGEAVGYLRGPTVEDGTQDGVA